MEGLIIPGGESSVISKHLEENNFRDKIRNFSMKKPIFGTCAGMILLSSTKTNKNVVPLKLLDYTVSRNAWGRQVDSFTSNLNIDSSIAESFTGYFIRSPKISYKGDSLSVLASCGEEPVMLTDGRHIVTSFHPEIGGDNRIHKFFIDKLVD